MPQIEACVDCSAQVQKPKSLVCSLTSKNPIRSQKLGEGAEGIQTHHQGLMRPVVETSSLTQG